MKRGTTIEKRPKVGSIFFLLTLSCLLFSGLIHLAFLQKAKTWRIMSFSPESYDVIVPRTFRLKKVEIDPKTLESELPPVHPVQPKRTPVELDNENPLEDHQSLGTSSSILNNPEEHLAPDNKKQNLQAGSVENELNKENEKASSSLKELLEKNDNSLLKNTEEKGLPLPEPSGTKGNSSGGESGSQQFSSLDDLLAASGTVKKGTAPILMPTDLLFEEDSETLKPDATETLTKLGNLMKRNVTSSFRIEGHTDSFGSDGYNDQLSLRRAEAVKKWLMENMGLSAAQMTTVGFGKRRLLAPASGTVEQQQLNRRVEIVIFTAQ